ncbi:MAG TPA: efflux RND transporter periplasmic adaptor subunit [Flavobacteriaceae bacterium]|nr:efflux RND transporter periplasmic adaptor subunit [Flavobacteriaceae bacterium]
MKTKNKKTLIVAGSILFGLLLGWIFFGGNKPAEIEVAHKVSEHPEETVWTCSMHPQIRQNEPGDCPICGMELIPVENGIDQQNPQVIHLSEYAKKLANVQTMTVGAEATANKIRLNGKVAVAESHSYSQSTHIQGRIERLYVNFTGEKVSRGQALAQIYSPELVTAQEELLQAYSIRESNPRLFDAAKEKLENWKISQNQINRILERGEPSEQFTISADMSGIVTEKKVELGDYVQRGTPIYEIANLSQVWVLFDIYENDMSWIEEGDKIEFTVASLPGKTFEGKVEFIDPLVNPQTRVSTARIVVDNEKGRLKPGMFVTGTVKIPMGENVNNKLTVPKSAVLWTGKRSVVYVQADDGSGYLLREVVLGPSLGDSYIIAEGLKPGEKVVVNGTFTVDAAAQLAGKPSMMSPEQEAMNNDGKTVEEDVVQIEISEPAKTALNQVVTTYLKLKNELVSDDFSTAKKNVVELEKTIEAINASGLDKEAKAIWESYREQLEKETNMLLKTNDIETLREGFVKFSNTLIGLVKTFELMDQTLYVLHCPMAKNNDGANWLSLSSEIQNPYFGSKMLKCGEVRDTL